MVRRGAILALAAFAAAVPAASAATINVNTLADQFGRNGKCALREALLAAQLDDRFSGCRSGAGTDVVRVVGGKTYRLTRPSTGPPNPDRGGVMMAGDVTVRPRGRGLATIDGSRANDSVLYAVDGDNVLKRVRVRDGHSDGFAGGIWVLGDASELTIRRSVITHNRSDDRGGGILSSGTLELRDTMVSGNRSGENGGGIAHGGPGTLIVVDSTVSGNTAGDFGGGLQLGSGSAVMLNSTISGNRSNRDGGGLNLLSPSGSVALFNATVTDNKANADGVGSGDGGGIENVGGSATAINSIVAGNHVGAGGSGPDCEGDLFLTYSLLGKAASCSGFSATPGNIVGVPAGLKPLADNGGPTRTHLLRRGAKARNRASPDSPGSTLTSCTRRDQRGVRRPQQRRCDMGSTEFKP